MYELCLHLNLIWLFVCTTSCPTGFSYDYGSVHVTSLSTEHPYTVGTPQYEWIANDLVRAMASLLGLVNFIVAGLQQATSNVTAPPPPPSLKFPALPFLVLVPSGVVLPVAVFVRHWWS